MIALRFRNWAENIFSHLPCQLAVLLGPFDFVTMRGQGSARSKTGSCGTMLIQPMAADDVASAVAKIAVGKPVNGTVEVAGPCLDDLIRRPPAARRFARDYS